MKYQELKKRLVMESGMIAAVVAVVGIGVFFLDDFSEEFQKSNAALESKVNEISNTTNVLSGKFNKIKQNSQLFKQIIELQSQDMLNINQQMAKGRFNNLRDQYYLSNLHLSMAPIEEVQDPAYKRSAYTLVSSDTHLDFDVMSDEYAYSLLDSIEQELPGGSKVTKLTLTRQGTITPEILRLISQKGPYALVKGEIKFMWLGIKPVEPTDSANAPKAK